MGVAALWNRSPRPSYLRACHPERTSTVRNATEGVPYSVVCTVRVRCGCAANPGRASRASLRRGSLRLLSGLCFPGRLLRRAGGFRTGPFEDYDAERRQADADAVRPAVAGGFV